MRLYDSILQEVLKAPDGAVDNLIIGWKGSFLSLSDGRWGVGSTPPEGGEPMSPQELRDLAAAYDEARFASATSAVNEFVEVIPNMATPDKM
ncbi:MAG TPA: hypothetical protein PLD93_00790, partial [Synergistaceae bacterium]|nr:hypothetical protein [Synergistaceae bacterium]